jgi:hypothetical protein
MHGKLSNAVQNLLKYTHLHIKDTVRHATIQAKSSGVHPVAINQEDGECAFFTSRGPRRQQSPHSEPGISCLLQDNTERIHPGAAQGVVVLP